MSILLTPLYHPSDKYILAALNLHLAKIQKISSHLQMTDAIEEHEGCYKNKINSVRDKLERLCEYPQCQKILIKEKIDQLSTKLLETSHFLEEHLSKAKQKNNSLFSSSLHVYKMSASVHLPLKNYILIKIAYRQARVEELSICLKQQKDVGKYKIWFENNLKNESSRIRSLNKYTSHCQVNLSKEIAACKASLNQIQIQFKDKLALSNWTSSAPRPIANIGPFHLARNIQFLGGKVIILSQ